MNRILHVKLFTGILALLFAATPATTQAGIIPWAYSAVFGPPGSLAQMRAQRLAYRGSVSRPYLAGYGAGWGYVPQQSFGFHTSSFSPTNTYYGSVGYSPFTTFASPSYYGTGYAGGSYLGGTSGCCGQAGGCQYNGCSSNCNQGLITSNYYGGVMGMPFVNNGCSSCGGGCGPGGCGSTISTNKIDQVNGINVQGLKPELATEEPPKLNPNNDAKSVEDYQNPIMKNTQPNLNEKKTFNDEGFGTGTNSGTDAKKWKEPLINESKKVSPDEETSEDAKDVIIKKKSDAPELVPLPTDDNESSLTIPNPKAVANTATPTVFNETLSVSRVSRSTKFVVPTVARNEAVPFVPGKFPSTTVVANK